jgi:glycosyltransferase involved in cell wall biosynthesis
MRSLAGLDPRVHRVAYLANEFPTAVEPYVGEEVAELRRRGMEVVPCSVRRPSTTSRSAADPSFFADTLCLQPLRPLLLLRAGWSCLRQAGQMRDLLRRIFLEGPEPVSRRGRALLHTGLGACLARVLQKHNVEHIHVHHGYFAAWVAMVAARMLGISYSLTLHGSDLLLHQAFLDTKLANCQFCITVSEYNRGFLLEHFPLVLQQKVLVQRMGVPASPMAPGQAATTESCFVLFSVGRLHAVKNHTFLIQACAHLKKLGFSFLCLIAGDGPERARLENLIRELDLTAEVRLLGQVAHAELAALYAMADLVVLTSHSEGIPLTLMEAMAQGKPVLAPRITGIPELVIHGETGFLYEPGSLEDFVLRMELIRKAGSALGPLRRAAREHVLKHFHRETNLKRFGDLFLERIGGRNESTCRESAVHQ